MGSLMPDLEVADLYERAVGWLADGRANARGENIVASDAVELICQWDDSARQMRSPKGDVVTVSSQVDVDQAVPIGSILFRGSIEDLANLEAVTVENVTQPAADLATLWEVVALDETPDMRSRVSTRTLGVNRYSEDISQAGES